MANFIKCKHESVLSKRMKKEIEEIKVVKGFFKSKEVITYKDVEDSTLIYENTPINIDLVINIKKIKGYADKDSAWGSIPSTEKFGISFYCISRDSISWFYGDEKTRDEQYEEISNNSQMYKSKVIL